jgi:hypothetical protein
MVVTPPFTHLSITFSNQKFSNCCPTVDVEFLKHSSDSFCANRVFKMNIQFCCQLCCSSCVIFWKNPSHCMMILFCNIDFRPLFFFADVVLPWFVYVDITLETAALDILNNVAVLSQMLQLNAHQPSVLFQNRTSLPFYYSFTRPLTQHNHRCTDASTTECKETEKEHSVFPKKVLSM